MSSVNSGVTGPKFTKVLYDTEPSFTLLMRTLRKRHPIQFRNARSTKKGSLPFFSTKLVAMAMSREISERGPARSSAPIKLLFGEKIAKIGAADPEIIVLQEIIKKEIKSKRKKEINASKIFCLVGNLVTKIHFCHSVKSVHNYVNQSTKHAFI